MMPNTQFFIVEEILRSIKPRTDLFVSYRIPNDPADFMGRLIMLVIRSKTRHISAIVHDSGPYFIISTNNDLGHSVVHATIPYANPQALEIAVQTILYIFSEEYEGYRRRRYKW